jgi:peptide/nickel transport system substrate-binding protein
MRKLSLLVAFLLVFTLCPLISFAEETAYTQSPMLDEKVEAGELPPVEGRLPDSPKLLHEMSDEYIDYEIGTYGGTIRLVTSSVGWSSDAFIGLNESLLWTPGFTCDDYEGNILEGYTVNEELTEYTFTLRKGLKWSDGVEVTMEDFAFAVNDFVFNSELTPFIANYMRDAGSSVGDPLTFDIIDENTFKISFKQSYGGFLAHLSVVGWKGYTDLLKPAHYLKQFHLSYAEECHGSLEAYYDFIAPYAVALGYDDPQDDGVWTYVFNQIDLTNWETSTPNSWLVAENVFPELLNGNMPVLYGWIMISDQNGVTTYERNPCYFKVDAVGQQMPYIDYITTTLVENGEMVQMAIITGEADLVREAASMDNISLYRENEESAGITAYITNQHGTPIPLCVNATYGLDSDGTVKDDDASRAWQEAISYPEFTRALILAIDADEIIETAYNGAAVRNEYYNCVHDIEAANELLDGIGMIDIDGDGNRETPSGLKLSWQIWNSANSTYWVPVSELIQEYWHELGLDVDINTTEGTLLGTSISANEVPMYLNYMDGPTTWWMNDWGISGWAPLWSKWLNAGGLSGTDLDADKYLEPPQEVKDFVLMMDSLLSVDSETAKDIVFPALHQKMAELGYLILPLQDMNMCVILNSDLGNVPTGGVAIHWGFSFEQYYYNQLAD